MRAGPGRLIAAVVTGLLAIATLAAAVWVVSPANWSWHPGGAPAAPAPETQTHLLPVAAGQTLTLRVRSGAGVTVVDGQPRQIAVTTRLRWSGWWLGSTKVTWAQADAAGGPEVTVGVSPDSWLLAGLVPAVAVDVALPTDVSLDLTADLGAVTLTGSHPQVLLAVSNGAVSAEGYRGLLQARSSNGRISVDGGTIPGDLRLATTNGEIVVTDTRVDGALRAATTNGGVNVQRMRLGGSFQLRSTNGAITYTGGGGQGGEAVTTNGAVSVQIDRPAAAGHYVISTPRGQQAWPDASGPQLGDITLASTNGAVQFSAGGNGS